MNPSWAIASKLPEYLPPLRPKEVGTSDGHRLPPVRILVHPEPIRVNYQTVRGLVPELWDLEGKSGRPRIDLAVHIGMAGPRPMYQIERRGHRDGYAMKDVEGEFLRDQERHAEEGKDWIWHDMPKELETDLDLDDVLEKWKEHSPVSTFALSPSLSWLFSLFVDFMLTRVTAWIGSEDIGRCWSVPVRLHLLLQPHAPPESEKGAKGGVFARAG